VLGWIIDVFESDVGVIVSNIINEGDDIFNKLFMRKDESSLTFTVSMTLEI
jgi:hypothetical protein